MFLWFSGPEDWMAGIGLDKAKAALDYQYGLWLRSANYTDLMRVSDGG